MQINDLSGVLGWQETPETSLDVLHLLAKSGLQAAWMLTLPDFDE